MPVAPAQSPDSRYPGAGRAWYIAFCLFAATVLAYIDRGIIALLIPDIKQAFGLTDTSISLIQGIAFSIPLSIAAVPAGHWVDRFNRRNMVAAGIIVWSLMTIGCGLAGTVTQLFLARAGVGAGEALLIPAAYSIVADCFAPDRRGRPMAVLVAGASMGGALSSFLAGVILKLLDGRKAVDVALLGSLEVWRFVFVLFGLCGVAFAALVLTFREPVRHGMGELTTQKRAEGQKFLGFARRHPALFSLMYLLVACNVLIATALNSWVMVALIRVYHVPSGDAGMIIGGVKVAANVSGAILGGFVGDALIARRLPFGRLAAWFLSLPMIAAGGLCMYLAPASTYFLAGFIIAGIFTAIQTSVTYPMIYDVVPASTRGQSVGYCMVFSNIIGTGLGTTILASITDYVFRDDGKVALSMGVLTIGFSLIGLVLLVALCRPYERLRLSDRADQT